MSNSSEKFDLETRDVINYLKSREEVCDIFIEDLNGVTNSQLNDWENRNMCSLPQDLKSFYLNQNGLLIEWKVKLEANSIMPLGKIQINSLKDLTKVGSVLGKDLREPSVFDLEDLQTAPNLSSLNSIRNFGDILNIKDSNTEQTNSDQESEYIDENKKSKDENQKLLIPHFDDLSRNFELDNCNGYGKVCLVYRNAKPGMMISEQSAEIWYLDRSLQWHYLTNSFKNYYRLAISHLGLPQWQMLFTEDGLPPFLNQWYYLFAPGRMMIHQDEWKKLDFLTLLENNTTTKKSAHQTPSIPESLKKIDFNKLFEDNQNKAKNNATPQQTTTSAQSQSSNQSDKNSNNNYKTRPRVNSNTKK